MTRKIGVVTGTRAEYGYLKPLMQSIKDHQELILRVYVTGMHLLKEQGDSIKEIERDGFEISSVVDMGSKAMINLHDLATSIGKGILGFSDLFQKDKPDIIVVLGDRNEPFAATVAATTMNIPVAHIAGGDVGFGDIDHILRHAITKLAHLHFVQTELSKERVLKLGEEEWRVMNVGALSIDSILNSQLLSRKELADKHDLSPNPYILVVYHPTTSEWNETRAQMRLVLESVDSVASEHDMDIVVIYPNDYPGGLEMIKVISEFVKDKEKVHVFQNLSHLDFISMMSSSSVLGRWVPRALISVTSSRATPAPSNSPSSTGSTRSLGIGRVRSEKTTATDCPGVTNSCNGGVPMGWPRASRRAAASSGSPGTNFGSTTATRSSGNSTHSPSLP